MKPPHPEQTARAAWLRVLALADPAELDHALQSLGPLPEHRMLRPPESGMAMVRARSGGTGSQFNLGEMTVTRCAVTLANGVMGVGYVPGRGPRHAEQAALADALLQCAPWHGPVHAAVIQPLAQTHARRVDHQARVAAQTKVEFFTLVRGDD